MEKVLVVKTDKLAKFISGRTGLLTEDREAMLDIIVNHHEFIDRPAAEEDPRQGGDCGQEEIGGHGLPPFPGRTG